MVAAIRRQSQNGSSVKEESTPLNHNADIEVQEDNNEPVPWIQRGVVALSNMPLTPAVLDGEVLHEAKKGNLTILDPKFAAYRVGKLLADLGFTSEDIGSEDLSNFIEDSLNYYTIEYQKEYNELQNEKYKDKREAILQNTIRQMKKMSAMLGLGRDSWTEQQWIDLISKQP